MKVKVILRAPKSQIPLYMTLNDAKFGNEEVVTSLNVVESDEVVHWVNNSNTTLSSNFQIVPQKQLEISEDLARSISSSLSEILKGRGIPRRSVETRIRDLKSGSNDLSGARHKYNVSQIKDAVPGKSVAEFAERPEERVSPPIESDEGTGRGNSNGERGPEVERLERLLSCDLDRALSSSSSSMGASFDSKYNGKALRSNLRKKYFRCSASSKGSKASYEYNKKFRSNDEFPELSLAFDDSREEKETGHSPDQNNTEAIKEKIQREIDNSSKMESIQCEIVKTFKNLTLNPCLCKNPKLSSDRPYDRNQVIYQKRLFLNELHEKVPPKQSQYYVSPKNISRNMYLLIHGSGEEPKDAASPKNLSSRPAFSSGIESLTREKCGSPPSPPETLKTGGPCGLIVQPRGEEDVGGDEQGPKKDLDPKSQLPQALSRLSLELSKASLIIKQCLKEEDVASVIDQAFSRDLQEKLDSLELLYRRMQIKTDQDESQNDQDERKSVRLSGLRLHKGFEDHAEENPSTPGSNKVPDTNLPLLADDVSFRKKDESNLVPRRLPVQKGVHSYYEAAQTLLQLSSRLESKRSISVPAHERKLQDPHSEKSTKSIGEIPYLNEIQDKSGNKSLVSITGVGLNSNNLVTNKPPQSKIGLKPNSSSERLSLELQERTRGRTRSQDLRNPRSNTRDFVAENKSNVALNACKSSSSLLQNNYNKKSTRLLKKKPPSIGKSQHSSTSHEESHFRYNRNHNQPHHLHQDEFDHFGSRNETYPSLEVGGPISRMNGMCGGFVPCLPGSYYSGHHYEYPGFGSFAGNHHLSGASYQHVNSYIRIPHYQQPNYQRTNSYIGASGLVDSKTPRCPYWCNLICKI